MEDAGQGHQGERTERHQAREGSDSSRAAASANIEGGRADCESATQSPSIPLLPRRPTTLKAGPSDPTSCAVADAPRREEERYGGRGIEAELRGTVDGMGSLGTGGRYCVPWPVRRAWSARGWKRK